MMLLLRHTVIHLGKSFECHKSISSGGRGDENVLDFTELGEGLGDLFLVCVTRKISHKQPSHHSIFRIGRFPSLPLRIFQPNLVRWSTIVHAEVPMQGPTASELLPLASLDLAPLDYVDCKQCGLVGGVTVLKLDESLALVLVR